MRVAKEGMSICYVTTLQKYAKMMQIIYFGIVIISLRKVIGFFLIKFPTNSLIVLNMNYILRFDYLVNNNSINLKLKNIMLHFILLEFDCCSII